MALSIAHSDNDIQYFCFIVSLMMHRLMHYNGQNMIKSAQEVIADEKDKANIDTNSGQIVLIRPSTSKLFEELPLFRTHPDSIAKLSVIWQKTMYDEMIWRHTWLDLLNKKDYDALLESKYGKCNWTYDDVGYGIVLEKNLPRPFKAFWSVLYGKDKIMIPSIAIIAIDPDDNEETVAEKYSKA
jgi:hypothetical protein